MESKHILIGISGGIAVYKICTLVSSLSKLGMDVRVILTKHAAQFVPPLTFEALSGHKAEIEMFGPDQTDPIPHIHLAQWADIFLMAPATANSIAKAVHGFGDDLLSSTMLALTCPKLMVPAMNTHMLENPATQANLKLAAAQGWKLISPAVGHLACMEDGKGRLPEPDQLLQELMDVLFPKAKTQQETEANTEPETALPLAGKHVLISAGPTRELLDPVRFLSNHSTGKQGYAIAKAAKDLGADVILVSGPVELEKPEGVELVKIQSALDLEKVMKEHQSRADFIIMAAAVADYRPKVMAEQKMKKSADNLVVEFVKNPDILQGLGAHKRADQVLCGFAMETENLDENGRKKLESKNCDLLIANNLTTPGAGFAGDTNIVSMIFPDHTDHLPLMSKEELGKKILETMLELQKGKTGIC